MMSDPFSPIDPYAPPQVGSCETSPGPLPKGLKAVCIICIVLGSLGTILSCGGAVGLALGQSMSEAFQAPQQPGMDERAREMQKELQEKITAMTRRYLPLNILAVVFHLISALLLLAGGIMTLKASAVGRTMLLAGCGAAIVYELGQGALNLVIQLKTIPLIKSMMDDAIQQGPGLRPGEVPDWLPQLMMGAMVVGLVIAVAIALAKIIFYVFSILYLQKPAIVSRLS
jgi:membrane protein YqaA with SNARE-associated domain